MTVDAATLDRIDVRYSVSTHFEFGGRDFFVAKASFQITAGVYSGITSKAAMAKLIMNRGVHEDDIDDLSGTDLSKAIVAAMIMEKGVAEGDIREMVMEEITVDEIPVAHTIY